MKMKKTEPKERFCGNCTSHNAYKYPDQVFCTRRFLKKKYPIVQTLWCCEEYYPAAQECNCIGDAKEKRK
jgi:hypothetical protein